MNEMTHEEFIEEIKHFISEIIDHSQSPGCGYHHIGFIPKNDQEIRRLLKVGRYFSVNLSVNLGHNEEIVYHLSCPVSHEANIIECLKKYDDPINNSKMCLRYMGIEERKEILNEYCYKCGWETGYCRCKF